MTGRRFVIVDTSMTLITERQRDVLKLANDGHGRKDIARTLGLGEETVKTHLDRVYAKLGARNMREACHIGRTLGIV